MTENRSHPLERAPAESLGNAAALRGLWTFTTPAGRGKIPELKKSLDKFGGNVLGELAGKFR
jgi:hypothetical protein